MKRLILALVLVLLLYPGPVVAQAEVHTDTTDVVASIEIELRSGITIGSHSSTYAGLDIIPLTLGGPPSQIQSARIFDFRRGFLRSVRM